MRKGAAEIDLDLAIGYRLKTAANAYHVAMERVLAPLGLTITQYSTLEVLAQRPGLSGAELARATFVTRQSMGAVLQTLTRDGLIDRAEAAPQGRSLPVALTAAGSERRRAASAAVRRIEDDMLAGLDGDESALLGRLLDRCARALDQRP